MKPTGIIGVLLLLKHQKMIIKLELYSQNEVLYHEDLNINLIKITWEYILVCVCTRNSTLWKFGHLYVVCIFSLFTTRTGPIIS